LNDEESTNYSLWVRLANDPSQSEQARQHYRAQMEAFLRERMREAFRAASQKAHSGKSTPQS
jgi:hypothetical protein